jgi:hypothetical protein
MMITPTDTRVTDDRRQDLLATAARVHLSAAAPRPAPSATPRLVDRIHADLRHAVAVLVAVAAIG